MAEEAPRWRWALAGLLSLGTVLRAFELGEESLWIDEAATLGFVRELDLTAILVELPVTEPHPPLYYAIVDVTSGVLGTGPAALRAPSVLFGVATLPLVYLLGRRWFDRRPALLATALFALARFHVGFAQEARMYSLLTFATVLSFWAFDRALEEPTPGRLLGYAGAALLTAYAHAFGLLALAVQAGHLVLTRARDPDGTLAPGGWTLTYAGVGLGLAPWLVAASHRVLTARGPDKLAWIEAPPPWEELGTPAAHLGLEHVLGPVAFAVAAAALLGLAGLGFRDGEGRGPRLAAAWALVVVGVPWVLSHLWFPVFVTRYTVLAGPAILLLVARGAQAPDRAAVRSGLVAVLLVAAAAPLGGYYAADQNEQWDEAAAHVGRQVSAGDVVVVANHRPGWIETRTAFTYYFEGSAPVVGVPADVPNTSLADEIEDRDAVWLVLSHLDEPDRSRLEAVVADRTGVQPSQRSFVGVDVLRYAATP